VGKGDGVPSIVVMETAQHRERDDVAGATT
jgi:hypothetical protein